MNANALARFTPACGPHHHASGRKCFTGSAWVWSVSRAARDSHARQSRAARERPGAWWRGPQAGVKRASAFAGFSEDKHRARQEHDHRLLFLEFFHAVSSRELLGRRSGALLLRRKGRGRASGAALCGGQARQLWQHLQEGDDAISLAGPLVLGGACRAVALEDLDGGEAANVVLLGKAPLDSGVDGGQGDCLARRSVALQGRRSLLTFTRETGRGAALAALPCPATRAAPRARARRDAHPARPGAGAPFPTRAPGACSGHTCERTPRTTGCQAAARPGSAARTRHRASLPARGRGCSAAETMGRKTPRRGTSGPGPPGQSCRR